MEFYLPPFPSLAIVLCQSKQYPVTISLQSIFKYKIENMEMKINTVLLRQQESQHCIAAAVAAKINKCDVISENTLACSM